MKRRAERGKSKSKAEADTRFSAAAKRPRLFIGVSIYGKVHL